MVGLKRIELPAGSLQADNKQLVHDVNIKCCYIPEIRWTQNNPDAGRNS